MIHVFLSSFQDTGSKALNYLGLSSLKDCLNIEKKPQKRQWQTAAPKPPMNTLMKGPKIKTLLLLKTKLSFKIKRPLRHPSLPLSLGKS